MALDCKAPSVLVCSIFLFAAGCGAPATKSNVGEVKQLADKRGGSMFVRTLGVLDLASVERSAALVGREQPGPVLEVVLATGAALESLDEAARADLRASFRAGVPVVSDGDEATVARALGLRSAPSSARKSGEYLAVKASGSRVARAFFHLSGPPIRSEYVSVPAAPVREALLAKALDWALADMSANASALAGDSQGAWNSIPDSFTDYVGYYLALDNQTVTNIIHIQVAGFKIPDLRPDKDWYLVSARYLHEMNTATPAMNSTPECEHSEVGWYMQHRALKIAPYGDDLSPYQLVDYGPTGTIGSGTVTIGIGGTISTSDISASAYWEHSYSTEDVTITDHSNLEAPYTYWDETFAGPNGQCHGTGVVDPAANTAINTFYSDRAAIFSTTDVLNGITLGIYDAEEMYYDIFDFPWYAFCLACDVVRYNAGGEDLLPSGSPFVLFYNYPPDQPSVPSLKTPVTVGDTVEASTTGTDPDGDALTFSFDFGDGTVTDFGDATQTHVYTDAGTYGVRVKSKDSPHGAESAWSETFQVVVKPSGGGGGGGGGGGCSPVGAGDASSLGVLLALFLGRALRRGRVRRDGSED